MSEKNNGIEATRIESNILLKKSQYCFFDKQTKYIINNNLQNVRIIISKTRHIIDTECDKVV